ncbi:MAG: HAMP domain-containing protein [Faecalibacterium sp.]
MTRNLKRFFLYLLFVASAAAVLAAFRPGWMKSAFATAFRGISALQYEQIVSNKSGGYWALGHQDGELYLASGTLGGSRSSQIALSHLGMEKDCRVQRLFACSDGKLLLTAQEGSSTELYLFDPKGNALVLLLTLPEGQTISQFVEEAGSVTFATENAGIETIWEFELGQSWLVKRSQSYQGGRKALLALPDGSVLRQEGTTFTDGVVTVSAPGEPVVSRSWYTTESLWYLDDRTGTLWKGSMGRGAVSQFTLAQAREICGSAVIDLSISDGGVLVLTEAGTLYRWRNTRSGFEDLSRSLLPSRPVSILLSAATIAAVLLAALALWYLVCEHQQMQIPLVFQTGLILLQAIVLMAFTVYQWVTIPYYQQISRDWLIQTLQAASRAPEISDSIFQTLHFEKQRDTWYLVRDSQQVMTAECLMYGESFLDGLEHAAQGALAEYKEDGSHRMAWFTTDAQGQVFAVTVDDAPYTEKYQKGCRETLVAAIPFSAAVWLIVLLILCDYTDRLHRISDDLLRIESGRTSRRLEDRRGDELSALANSVNTMADLVEKKRRQDLSMRSGYACFLPESLIRLLNVKSVEEIDRKTFARLEKATLHVELVFDASVYASHSRLLFDCMNEIIGRTAGHISAKEGIILSFSYNGYDAVFPPDGVNALSAAVAIRQETLAINEEHQQRGLPEVKLYATLDTGELMVGVVGGESRMQIVALSSSFSVNRALGALFQRVDANILCTEKIAAHAEGMHSRYIGKLLETTEEVRVYEIYEGDDLALRLEKKEHAALFAEGIYLFYAGEFEKAKRIFMNIVRTTPRDGVARHYLYLADQFQRSPPARIGLDV